MAVVWNPWRGCHRCSIGCKHCYIHKGDAKQGVNTENVVKTAQYDAPIRKKKNGEYKMEGIQLVYVCFQSDFLVEDADWMRPAAWQMMHTRNDLEFLFLTKRITRMRECLPPDWGNGYSNVTVGCTIEDQNTADLRLKEFVSLPIAHRNIIVQPMLGPVDLRPYLDRVELVVVGGESDREGRILDYAWVLDVREQCKQAGVHFEFRQCATHFRKDGVCYTIPVRSLMAQARKANINL